MEAFHLPYQRFDFKQPLAPYEISKLRAAVISQLKPDSLLYHHHLGKRFLFKYPLIQYKSIGGKASILYLGKAIEHIASLFYNLKKEVILPSGDRVNFEIKRIVAKLYQLKFHDHFESYILSNWLPLQGENYIKYRQLNHENEKIKFLKKMLKGNILTFAKGVEWKVEGEIQIPKIEILKEQWISYKDTKMLGFQAKFSTNIFLPPYIGLGKGASKNYGVIKKAKLPVEQHNEIKIYE